MLIYVPRKLIIVCISVFLLFGCENEQEVTSYQDRLISKAVANTERTKRNAERTKRNTLDKFAEEAKNNIANSLKDPSSAQFRKLRVGNNLLCGEINAKNSFGAYIGYKKFRYYPGDELRIEGSNLKQYLWDDCHNKSYPYPLDNEAWKKLLLP